MFKFQDVSEKDFNAVFRRSLVWRVKTRFEDPEAIEGLKKQMFLLRSTILSVSALVSFKILGFGVTDAGHNVLVLSLLPTLPGAYDDIRRLPQDSELKSFLTSGPAILAPLQKQNAFELKHRQEECARMIEAYAYWGGDGDLTEQVMHEACGVPL